MKIGIEVETVYNMTVVGEISAGGYGNGVDFLIAGEDEYRGDGFPKWTSQRDSSIMIGPQSEYRNSTSVVRNSTSVVVYEDGTSVISPSLGERFFSEDSCNNCSTSPASLTPILWKPCPVELVSHAVSGRENFMKVLKQLKELMTWKNKNAELRDVMKFNNSCGCHVHFSFGNININKICGYSPLIKVRNAFFKGLNELNIRKELKASIRAQYFRSYANKLNKVGWKNNVNVLTEGRNCEFNFRSYEQRKGFEWRSFNLCGVKTWDEFFKLLMLAYDSLDSLKKHVKKFTDRENYSVGKESKSKINQHSGKKTCDTKLNGYKSSTAFDVVIRGLGDVSISRTTNKQKKQSFSEMIAREMGILQREYGNSIGNSIASSYIDVDDGSGIISSDDYDPIRTNVHEEAQGFPRAIINDEEVPEDDSEESEEEM